MFARARQPALYDRLQPHALAAAEHAEGQGVALDAAARLFNQIGFYRWNAGRLHHGARGASAGAGDRRDGARAVLADIGDPGSLHPSRAAWVSTFAGDAAVAYGDLDAALAAYQASLVIRQRLAAADPSNAAWQRDLSVSHNKLGDVLRAQGQLGDALAAYQASLVIFERLAAADPSNAAWQRDLFVSYARLGSVLEQVGDVAAAAEQYGKGRAITVRLTERDPSNATWRNDRAWIEQRLAALGGGDGRDGP